MFIFFFNERDNSSSSDEYTKANLLAKGAIVPTWSLSSFWTWMLRVCIETVLKKKNRERKQEMFLFFSGLGLRHGSRKEYQSTGTATRKCYLLVLDQVQLCLPLHRGHCLRLTSEAKESVRETKSRQKTTERETEIQRGTADHMLQYKQDTQFGEVQREKISVSTATTTNTKCLSHRPTAQQAPASHTNKPKPPTNKPKHDQQPKREPAHHHHKKINGSRITAYPL